MTDTTHLIGLLLGTEEDWPAAFETLIAPARADHRRRRASGTRSRPSA